MRDSKRIKPFLKEIEKIWNDHPDWRFMQLMCNIQTLLGNDGFFIEDEEILNKIKEYFHIEDNKCGTCDFFLGNGDWDLCCSKSHDDCPMGFLCYENTPACKSYKKKEE